MVAKRDLVVANDIAEMAALVGFPMSLLYMDVAMCKMEFNIIR